MACSQSLGYRLTTFLSSSHISVLLYIWDKRDGDFPKLSPKSSSVNFLHDEQSR